MAEEKKPTASTAAPTLAEALAPAASVDKTAAETPEDENPNHEGGLISAKAQVVLVAPLGETLTRLAQHLSTDADLKIHEANTNSAPQMARKLMPSLVIASISKTTDVVKYLTMIKPLKDELRSKAIKFIVISRINNPAIIGTFESFGCQEYIVEPISERSLGFKIGLQTKALKAQRKILRRQEENQGDPLKKLGKGAEGAGKDAAAVKPDERVEQKEAADGETWVFRGKQPKKQGGKWSMRMKGPEPGEGDWVQLEDKEGGSKWRFEEKDKDGKPKKNKEGWEWSGEKPTFANGEWNMQSEKPELSLVDETGKKKATKVETNPNGSLSVTKDSEAGLKNVETRELEAAMQRNQKKNALFAGEHHTETAGKDRRGEAASGHEHEGGKSGDKTTKTGVGANGEVENNSNRSDDGKRSDNLGDAPSGVGNDNSARTDADEFSNKPGDLKNTADASGGTKKKNSIPGLDETPDISDLTSAEAHEQGEKNAATGNGKVSEADSTAGSSKKSEDDSDDAGFGSSKRKSKAKEKKGFGLGADVQLDEEDYENGLSPEEAKKQKRKKGTGAAQDDASQDDDNSLGSKSAEARKKRSKFGAKDVDDEEDEKDPLKKAALEQERKKKARLGEKSGEQEIDSDGSSTTPEEKKKKALRERSKSGDAEDGEGDDAADALDDSERNFFKKKNKRDDENSGAFAEDEGGFSSHKEGDKKKSKWGGHDSEEAKDSEGEDKFLEVDAPSGALNVKPGEDQIFEYPHDHFGSLNGAWETVGADQSDPESRKVHVFLDLSVRKLKPQELRAVNGWWIFRGDRPSFHEQKKLWFCRNAKPSRYEMFDQLPQMVREYLLSILVKDASGLSPVEAQAMALVAEGKADEALAALEAALPMKSDSEANADLDSSDAGGDGENSVSAEADHVPSKITLPSAVMTAVFLAELSQSAKGDVNELLQTFCGFLTKNLDGMQTVMVVSQPSGGLVVASTHSDFEKETTVDWKTHPDFERALKDQDSVAPKKAGDRLYCALQTQKGGPAVGVLMVDPGKSLLLLSERVAYFKMICLCLRGSLRQVTSEKQAPATPQPVAA